MRRQRTVGLALILLGGFTGCRSSEPPPSRASLADWVAEREQVAAVELPMPTSEEGDQIEARSLQLESPAGALRGIGLREVLTLVETQGLDIQLARERLVEVQAEESIARAAWWPSLSIGTTLYRNEGRVQGTTGLLLNVDKQNAWAGGGVRLDLDLGEAIYGTRAARHRTAASSSTLLAETQNASTLAALAYFDLVESHARLPIAEDAQAHARELVEFEEARLAAGAGLEADLARARAHQAAIERAAIETRVMATRASSLLVELLQLPPDTHMSPDPEGLSALSLVSAELLPVGGAPSDLAVAAALNGRPELRAAEAALAASDAEQARAANAWLLPRLVVAARIGALGEDYSDLESQDVYTAALQWDLGVELFGDSDRMSSKRRQTELERRRTTARVHREVNVAAAEYEAALLSVEATRVEAQAAASAHELARKRHESGAALLIERLDAQVQSLRSRVAQTAALVNFNRAQFSYVRALGLGGISLQARD